MRIAVLGLWHLGCVTAAALAKLGHEVIGLDADEARIRALRGGKAPVYEPGLEALLRHGLATGGLHFFTPLVLAQHGPELLWVAMDTPIDSHGRPDAEAVLAEVERLLPALPATRMVLISSQLPVGSVRRLERAAASDARSVHLRFACCPENLRLGSAVGDFLRPARIIAGVRSPADRALLHGLLQTISDSLEWMTVESAEMTKHAVNAFLATSVSFANELATLCEAVGADAKQVERGLKSDARIGSRAYLAPGAGFAGGTLERDVASLAAAAAAAAVQAPLLHAVLTSNAAHSRWAQRKLRELFGALDGTTVAVWGLTYKPGTDTLRRSHAVELCDWMLRAGAKIHVHDPAVKTLPAYWGTAVRRFEQPLDAVRGARALILATAWPIYHSVTREQLLATNEQLVVLDADHCMPQLLGADGRPRYLAVGRTGSVPA